MAIIVLSAALASAVAPTSLFPHATPVLVWTGSVAGCSTGRVGPPSLSTVTGIGHDLLKAHAITCPAARGGTGVTSSSTVQATVGVSDLINLTRSVTSVAISWSVRANGSTNVTGHARTCPSNTSFSSYPIYIGGTLSTWVYDNSTVTYCAAESMWEIVGAPYVYDASTGTTTYASFAPQESNVSGNYFSAYQYVYNYSNSSYTNQTYHGTTALSFGAAAALSIAWSPTWYINGTFALGDRLVVVATIEVVTIAYVAFEKHASSTTDFVATGSADHLDLTGITFH